jgi:hypothetical protein
VHLVCSPERAGLYPAVVEGSGLQLRTVSSVGDAVRACVAGPGRAVMVDMSTTLHAGVSETAPLYEMGINLPILRCTQVESGEWTAMCQAPFKRLPLLMALKEIAQGDPSWQHPKFVRRYVRVPLSTRVRFRLVGSANAWKRANCSNASISGLFLLTQEIEPIGSELELEILDAGGLVQGVRGFVTWAHAWDDGPHLPGMGVDFDLESVPDAFREFLAETYTRKRG